jgi:hypothetical protein
MEYCSAIRRNQVLRNPSTTWINLENIMVSPDSKGYITDDHLYKMFKKCKSIQTERLVFVRVCEEG